jgi:hypothetical protein
LQDKVLVRFVHERFQHIFSRPAVGVALELIAVKLLSTVRAGEYIIGLRNVRKKAAFVEHVAAAGTLRPPWRDVAGDMHDAHADATFVRCAFGMLPQM